MLYAHARTAGFLYQAALRRLEALPDWSWDPYVHEEAWDEGFASLQGFVEREGHARVPVQWRENGYRLGQWANHQRRFFAKGQLDKARCERLEAVPGWVWDRLEAAWEEGFAILQGFVEREGHARVPFLWREDGYRLGQWVGSQRRNFGKGRLDNARRERLETLPGWEWDPLEAAWEEGFAKLETFIEREGPRAGPERVERRRISAGWVGGLESSARVTAEEPLTRSVALVLKPSPTGPGTHARQRGRRALPGSRASLIAKGMHGFQRSGGSTATDSAGGLLVAGSNSVREHSAPSDRLDLKLSRAGPGTSRSAGRRRGSAGSQAVRPIAGDHNASAVA